MPKTALDLTAEELRSYQPDRKSNDWQMAERWERAWELAQMVARLLRERFGLREWQPSAHLLTVIGSTLGQI